MPLKPSCLIVGAGDGVGSAIARAFAREGLAVCITRRPRNLESLEAVAATIRADGGEARRCSLTGLGAGDASKVERQGDIGQGIGPGHQGRALEDEAGGPAGRAHDGSTRGCLQPGQKAQQGGLAGPGRADDGHDLAPRHGQVIGAEGRTATEGDRDTGQGCREVRTSGRRKRTSHGRADRRS